VTLPKIGTRPRPAGRNAGIAGAFLVIALLSTASSGAGQTQPPTGTGAQDEAIPTFHIVGAAKQKIPIALPAFLAGVGAGQKILDACGSLRDVVKADLDFSGYFQIVPDEYLKLVRDSDTVRVNFKEWLGIGAESLLLGKVGLEAATVVFDGRVFDTSNERVLVGKRYRGDYDQLRLMAHKLSNEVVQQYTGQPGIALTKIAFVSQVGKAKEIYVMDYDGARAKRITGNGSINLSPAWSPDGGQIAFVSYRTGQPELVILNSSGELRRAFPQSGELNSAPAWSPDGRLLAFSSSRDGNAEIYTLRVADGSLNRLTRHEAIDTSPAWSPTGKEIAFTSDRSGSPQIFLMDADGGNARRLTFEVSYCDAASWSPLGDKIVFTGRVPGGFDLYVKDLQNGQIGRLTENSNINEWPRWSPDGRHIIFASNRTGSYDIYTIDFDGSNLRRLTHGGNNSSPSWSR
jgi:TolB protein